MLGDARANPFHGRLAHTSHFLNFSTLVSIGGTTASTDLDGISLNNGNTSIRSVNFTMCSVPQFGAAFTAQGQWATFDALFLTVVKCSGAVIVFIDESESRPMVRSCHFALNVLHQKTLVVLLM
jgi:hypothetical protein